jgi:hypothetical protein
LPSGLTGLWWRRPVGAVWPRLQSGTQWQAGLEIKPELKPLRQPPSRQGPAATVTQSRWLYRLSQIRSGTRIDSDRLGSTRIDSESSCQPSMHWLLQCWAAAALQGRCGPAQQARGPLCRPARSESASVNSVLVLRRPAMPRSVSHVIGPDCRLLCRLRYSESGSAGASDTWGPGPAYCQGPSLPGTPSDTIYLYIYIYILMLGW